MGHLEKVTAAVLMVLILSSRIYAKDISSSEILSDLPHYIGQTVTLKGLFLYNESIRESLTIDQNGKLIEVFYRDLPKNQKDFIAARKDHSREEITVTGIVGKYENRPNAFFLFAASVQSGSAVETSPRNIVSYADILSDPQKFIGKKVTLKGLFLYAEPMRGSFTFDQNNKLIEAFYGDLPPAERDRLLTQKQYSKAAVIVTGIVRQYTNKQNTYFLDAVSVSLN